MADEPLRVNRSLEIPADELELSFTTSGGPGGQHANRSATRAELAWNAATSRALGPRQRQRILTALKNRIDSSGTLRLSSNAHRSQLRNREEVTNRLAALLRDALRPTKKRRATFPTASSRERRLAQKRRRGEIKRARAAPDLE